MLTSLVKNGYNRYFADFIDLKQKIDLADLV